MKTGALGVVLIVLTAPLRCLAQTPPVFGGPGSLLTPRISPPANYYEVWNDPRLSVPPALWDDRTIEFERAFATVQRQTTVFEAAFAPRYPEVAQSLRSIGDHIDRLRFDYFIYAQDNPLAIGTHPMLGEIQHAADGLRWLADHLGIRVAPKLDQTAQSRRSIQGTEGTGNQTQKRPEDPLDEDYLAILFPEVSGKEAKERIISLIKGLEQDLGCKQLKLYVVEVETVYKNGEKARRLKVKWRWQFAQNLADLCRYAGVRPAFPERGAFNGLTTPTKATRLVGGLYLAFAEDPAQSGRPSELQVLDICSAERVKTSMTRTLYVIYKD